MQSKNQMLITMPRTTWQLGVKIDSLHFVTGISMLVINLGAKFV